MAKKSKEGSALGQALSKFQSTMGDGVVHTANSLPECLKIKSSVPMYNYVTDGGFTVGRIIEHSGENSSCKSYLAYDAIAQFQKFDWANREPNAIRKVVYEDKDVLVKDISEVKLRKGYKPKEAPEVRRAALVDIEATYTPEWGERIFGIDNAGLIIIRPSFLTEVVDIVQMLLADPMISLVVIDSLSAVGTDDEVDSSMESNQMASAAKFWNKAFRKFQSAMNANPTKESTLLVINSSYQKVGIVYGDPEELRNGEQLRRSKTLAVKFRGLKAQSAKTDSGDLTIGRNVIIKCLKNKTGISHREGNFFYSFVDYGLCKANKTDTVSQLVELGIKSGLIIRSGAWYSYGDLRCQGMEAFSSELSNSGAVKSLEEELNH